MMQYRLNCRKFRLKENNNGIQGITKIQPVVVVDNEPRHLRRLLLHGLRLME